MEPAAEGQTSLGLRPAGRKHTSEPVEGVRNKAGALRNLTTQPTHCEEETEMSQTFQNVCHTQKFTAKSGNDFYQILCI